MPLPEWATSCAQTLTIILTIPKFMSSILGILQGLLAIVLVNVFDLGLDNSSENDIWRNKTRVVGDSVRLLSDFPAAFQVSYWVVCIILASYHRYTLENAWTFCTSVVWRNIPEIKRSFKWLLVLQILPDMGNNFGTGISCSLCRDLATIILVYIQIKYMG